MKFDIQKKLMSQSSYSQIPNRSVDIGDGWRGKLEILENTYKCRRYVIDITGLDLLSLEEFSAGGGAQCFGDWMIASPLQLPPPPSKSSDLYFIVILFSIVKRPIAIHLVIKRTPTVSGEKAVSYKIYLFMYSICYLEVFRHFFWGGGIGNFSGKNFKINKNKKYMQNAELL